MTTEATRSHRRAKERSPSYPGIPLEEAIKQVRALYEQEHRSPAPVDAAVAAWGYAPKSSAGLVTLAALRKFGLVESEGAGPARRVRVSDEAFAIIQDTRPDSAEYRTRIREAALRPPIHAELWAEYGNGGHLPSDETLRYELRVHRGFSESGAREFIKQFRATVEFARLGYSDNFAAPEEPMAEVPAPSPPGLASAVNIVGTGTLGVGVTTGAVGAEVRTLTLPIAGPVWPVLQVPYPMSEEAWEQMIMALEVFRRGVVRNAPGPVPETADSLADTNTP